MSPKRISLWFLIVSVALSAVFGIVAILSGDFGDFEGRVIHTTITISAASSCALAAGARCGMTQPNSYTAITCTSCGCRFVVTIIEATSASEPI